MTSPLPFSWWRELPLILLAGVLAVLVRVPAIQHAWSLFDSDNSLGPIMAKHIWEDGYRPIMCNGQDYLGAGEAYIDALAVPFFPGDPSGIAIVQVALFILCLFPIYRLCHLIGGRAGATTAVLVLAVGSPWLIRLTTNAAMGYLSNLFLSVVLLLLGLRVLERTTTRGLVALGLLTGLGYWNNPAILIVVAALGFAFWCRGAVCSRRAEGQLGAALSTRVGLALKVLAGVSLVAFVAICALPAFGPFEKTRILGIKISLSRVDSYFPRGVALLGLTAVLFELYLSRARDALLRGGGAFAIGAALGASPLIVYFALGSKTGVKAWMRYRPDKMLAWLPGWVEGADRMVLGPVETTHPAYVGLRWAVAAFVLSALLAALWVHRKSVTSAILARRTELSPLLIVLLPALALLLVGTMRGGLKPHRPRYFFPLWLSFVALLSWTVQRLSRWRPTAALGVVLVLLGYFAVAQIDFDRNWLPEHDHREEAELIKAFSTAGVTHGYGNYWVAFKLSYLSNERMLIACDYDPGGNMHRFPEWKAEADRDRAPLFVFDFENPEVREDSQRADEMLARMGHTVTERQRFGGHGRYVVYRVKR